MVARCPLWRAEDALIVKALKDANIAKFVGNDVALFLAILSDVFPSASGVESASLTFLTAVREACHQLGIVATEAFVAKVIQTKDVASVRHGFMLVGRPFAGKTSVLRVLSAAVTAHSDIVAFSQHRVAPMEREYPIAVHTINPIAVTMSELYGRFDEVAGDATDGVLTKVFRACANAPLPDVDGDYGDSSDSDSRSSGGSEGEQDEHHTDPRTGVTARKQSSASASAPASASATASAAGLGSLGEDLSFKRQWIVFDGPVDTAWIENLNTVRIAAVYGRP